MDDYKSKTQLKREAENLKKIGMKLVDLKEDKLQRLPLPDALMQAILTAKSIKSHGAMRRQAQLIGKLMRSANHDDIIAAYEQILAEESAKTADFHQVERWRERLILEGRDALTQFIDEYQPEDVQKLRQLVKKAIEERQNEKNIGAGKALFKYIRSIVT